MSASARTKARRRVREIHRRLREAKIVAWGLLSTRHPLQAHIIPVRRCNLACTYCNEFDDFSKPVPLETLNARLAHLSKLGTTIITISGGEPLHQITEALRLLHNLKREALDLSIGLFSGYTEQELQQGRFQTYFPSIIWLRQAQWRELESLLDFAVLGRYNQQQPSADPLITSRNQRLRL